MDTSEYSKNKIIYWIILISTLFLSALSWFFDLTPYLPSNDWRWLAIIFSILFIVTSILRITNLERILSSRKPKLEVYKSPYVTDIPFSEVRWYVTSDDIMDYKIAKIAFVNNPKNNTELNHANLVNTQLIYKDVDGKVLVGPIYAHWSNNGKPMDKADALRNRLIFNNLDSSGVPESIYLAIKNLPSKSCYAFSDLSYFDGFENPAFSLEHNIIDLNISLKGERVKKCFKCRIYNDGENFPLRIEMRKSWITRVFSKLIKKNAI